ncbi:MAG: aminomethyltransferase family protein [Acidobacteriia bacterium]|nr:aminomethyltransferase family protein [Terriglobia bacterium]
MTKRTALHGIEKTLGAAFGIRSTPGPEGPEGAWEIASVYSTVDDEYAAVREGIGFFDFSHRGKIRVKGPDSLKYLHGQVTNEIKKLPLHAGCYALALTHKGAVIGDLNIYRTGVEELLIDTSEYCTHQVFDQLLRFAISDDVEIENVGESICHLAIHGPGTIRFFLEQLHPPEAERVSPSNSIQESTLDSSHLLVVRQGYDKGVGWTGEIGFDLFLEGQDPGKLWNAILQKGKPYGMKCVGMKAFNTLRLEAGVPLYGLDMSEDNLPQEVLASEDDFRRAISTDKGCYIGQEVVARLVSRGHVNRVLAGLILNDTNEPRRRSPLFDGGKAVGELTSTAWSPSLKKIVALGYVPFLREEPDYEFSVGEPNSTVQARVVPLPFYTTRHLDGEELPRLNWTTEAH